jgi:anti-sigma factor RsiW
MIEDTNRMWHESPEYRQEQFSTALDGMLTPDEQTALDAHLAGCETCPREMEELRQVRMLLRALPEPALPRSFLLPTAGELAAPRSPARVAERQPAANVTPLRQTARRSDRATRTLRVTRWIGTIAAVLGMALFLGSLLPMLTHQGAASSASAPLLGAQNGSTNPAADKAATQETNPSPTQHLANGGGQTTDQTVTAATATTATKAPTYSGAATPTVIQAYQNTPGSSLGDILRTVALVLLFGGATLALASFIVARVM